MSRKMIFGGVLVLGAIVAVGLVLGAVALPAQAEGPMGGGWTRRGHMEGGMMRGWGQWGSDSYAYGRHYTQTVPYGGFGPMGMMGGFGSGCAMMGGSWGGVDSNAQPLTMEQATENVNEYLAAAGNGDLQLAEMMEFAGNFYAEVREKSTGIGALELLVDRYSGQVYPEPGPNMMWNLKYGHMGGWGMMRWRQAPEVQMPVTPEQAVEEAQNYLDRLNMDLKAGKAEQFYGYYTLHTQRDGKVTGMLGVNGYTGAVWYHAWHGDFVGMEEMEME